MDIYLLFNFKGITINPQEVFLTYKWTENNGNLESTMDKFS